MNNKIGFIIIASILFANSAYAQKSDVGNWFSYFGNQKINKKWNWHNEVQYRNYNFIGDINQLLIRTGIGYNLSENNDNILLGYGFIQSHNYTTTGGKNVKNEHRIFQQFITKSNIQNFYVQHRYRVEERFFTDDYKLRLRYFLSVNKPLNKKALEKDALYLSAYNEIFLNANKPVFDRNRLYGGVGYCISDFLRIETGFMSQMLENKKQSQFQILFFNNLPFTRQN
ncbi:MAG: DUF2490 domain-containing protein [Flavobacterium sp.]|nr:DUF2490 domain-containing protein [Pedobacter sp.]